MSNKPISQANMERVHTSKSRKKLDHQGLLWLTAFLRPVNPFAKRESHGSRSLIAYKTLTILSWLLVLVLSVIYSFDSPSDGKKSHNHTIWGQNKHNRTPFSLNPFIADVYW